MSELQNLAKARVTKAKNRAGELNGLGVRAVAAEEKSGLNS